MVEFRKKSDFWLYRFPPTRGADFCIGLAALVGLAGLAAGGAFLAVVAFWVFLTSLAALKGKKYNLKETSESIYN